MKITAIIPAAGVGRRMNKDVKKQYILINNKPILAHTLETFQQSNLINEIIVVTNKDELDYCKKNIVEEYSINKVTKVIEGGVERQESVYKGIKGITSNPTHIIIHDGVRPFIKLQMLNEFIIKAKDYKAAAVGVPVKDTIKSVSKDGYIINTLDRSKVWAIHTPQFFEYNTIRLAHERALNDNYIGTDDTVLVEKYTDTKIKMIKGNYFNIKITTEEDLILGQAILTNYLKNILT